VIDVPDRPNVHVRLAAVKFLFRHGFKSLLSVSLFNCDPAFVAVNNFLG
jgi:hypothetical protein